MLPLSARTLSILGPLYVFVFVPSLTDQSSARECREKLIRQAMCVDPLSSLTCIYMQRGPQEVLEFSPWLFADSGSRQQRQKSALPFANGLRVLQQTKPIDFLALSNSASLPCPGRNNWSLKTQTRMESECHCAFVYVCLQTNWEKNQDIV